MSSLRFRDEFDFLEFYFPFGRYAQRPIPLRPVSGFPLAEVGRTPANP